MHVKMDLQIIAKQLLLALLLAFVCASRAEAQLRSDLRVFSDSFISPSFNPAEKTNYQFVGTSLSSPAVSTDILKMNIEGAVAFGAPLLNYLNISELYFQSTQSENDHLFIGRKLLPWSDLDDRWQLGLWQPLFQWNPLAPQQQGLTGIFWQARREGFAITLFGSPVFLPNQGPSFEVKDGAFVDGNPWFQKPPSSVMLFKKETLVDYTVEKPNEAEVVFKTSFGAKLNLGSADGISFQLSSIYKPSNELAIGLADGLNTGDLHGKVTVKPQVFYHSITAADLSQRISEFRYGVSGLWDRPQKNIDFEERFTQPHFSDAILVSPFIEWIRPSYILTLQGLFVDGGEVTETGDLASTDRMPFTLRYPYREAAKISLENRFAWTTNRLSSRLSYTISDLNDFELLQLQLKWRWSRLWSVFGEGQLVRADDTSVENQNRIAQYRNLDRVLLGAAYVF